MRIRILSLAGALALSLVAMTGMAPAKACSSTFCADAREECLSGCPCATFTCKPASCYSSCVCPIFC
jgi:hypothetical protein